MPTSNSKVNFHFISTTAPASYDANTVYFDNINHTLKVGENVIANGTWREICLEDSLQTIGADGISGTTEMSAYQINQIYTSNKNNQCRLVAIVHANGSDTELPLIHSGPTIAVFAALEYNKNEDRFSLLGGPSSSNFDPQIMYVVVYDSNGSSYYLIKEVDLSSSGGSGSSSEEILLGQTPLTLTEDASKLILSGSGTYDYTIQSETQVEPDISNGTFSNTTLTYEDNQYKLKAGSGATAWYQAYVDINVSGLIEGAKYNFIFDGAGCTYNETTHVSVGHFILYDGNGSTLVTRGNTDTNKKNVYAFTAPTSTARIRWYTATNNTFSAGVSVANINGFYFNREGTTNHTAIVNLSGSFTDTTELRSIPAGCLVNTDPVGCQVSYKVGEDTGTYAPLKDKTIVCFGDSLFGMYRGDTSATSYIEQYTGATVYNVGFGGCRMSTHPSHGYAEFSMYRLAQAIANNNWTDQDTYASQGSSYFPEQLATLKSIDFSKVDYAVIHYGTNDFGGNVVIENSSNNMDTSTICGALRTSITTLLGAYPKLQLFISLPVYRYWTSNNVNTYAETYQNTLGNYLPQVVEAIRKVAIEYHLPVIDGYNGMGINSINASQFLEDGTHHNQAGRERFGTFIAEQLLSPTNYVVKEGPIEIRLSDPGYYSQYEGTGVNIPHTGPSWTKLHTAGAAAKEIHLIINNGGYNKERYTSYSLDDDAETFCFFAPARSNMIGFYWISQNGTDYNVTYTSFPNATTSSY